MYSCREWGLLSNLPKISVMEGSPTNRADLRSVKVNLARTVILLSAMVGVKKCSIIFLKIFFNISASRQNRACVGGQGNNHVCFEHQVDVI